MDDAATLFENATRESAAEHLCTRVPVASVSSPVKEIRDSLHEGAYESLTHVAILDEARLVGVIIIEDLFSAPDATLASEVMDTAPPVAAPGTDQEVVARRAVRHGESALAVVDEEHRFLGFVPPHRLLAVLLWEHEEDMDRLGGFLRGTEEARNASQEPAGRRFRHRVCSSDRGRRLRSVGAGGFVVRVGGLVWPLHLRRF